MQRNLLFIGLFFLLIFNKTKGQLLDDSYLKYVKQDGLPSNTIYSLCNDLNGFIWIGTDAGLCRFDGCKIVTYTNQDGLPNNDVFQLFCDSRNRVWITTMGKEVSYCKQGKIFNSDTDTLLRKIKTNAKIINIFEDKAGAIWIISYPFIINKISNERVETFDFSNQNICCYNSIMTESGIYFITIGRTYYYNFKSKSFSFTESKDAEFISGLQVINNYCYFLNKNFQIKKTGIANLSSGIFRSKIHFWPLFLSNGMLWQLSNKGIKSYESKDIEQYRIFLKNYSVSNYLRDCYGNSWISTLNNGLFKLNSMCIKNYKPSLDVTSNSIYSVFINKENIFAGNNNGEISIISKNQLNNVKKIKITKESILTFRILKIIQEKEELIICTDIGVYSYSLTRGLFKQILPLQATKNVFIENGKLIILNNVGVYYLHSMKTESDISTLRNISKRYEKASRFYSYCTYKGKSLFGSENTLYYEKDSLIPYPLDQALHCRMMDMKVIDSLLVIATTEKGIFFINGNKVIENLNLERGLNSNNCSKIVPYKNELFVATNNGICRYNYHTKAISRIMESDGLASNNVLDLVLDHDTLYAGTDNGLSVIPVSSLTHRTSFSFFINPIVCNKDTTWDIVDTVNIHTDQPLSFTLNAISLGVKGNVTYFYRIKEQDTVYKSTSEPSMSFKLFNTGTYTFEAYSVDVNGLKSVMATLHVIVVPYWWQTWIFKFACVLAALIALFLFHRFMTQLIRKREQIKSELKNKMIRLELDAWKSNINPHFMFNSFNAIQSMFASASYERANEFISNFASVLRKTIDNSGRLMNKFPEEIAYLTNILELERMKKMRKLSYQIFYDEQELDRYYIPSLLLQPIVENAVKHGVKHQRNGHIVIEFTMQSETITAIVRDNGVGLTDTKKDYTHSKGLKLVRDKIRIVESVTNTSIEFRIENVYGTNGECLGVAAIFVLPKFLEDDLTGFDVSA